MEVSSIEEFKQSLDTGLSSVLLRNWLEFCDTLAKHLENRAVHTFGKVVKFFIRYEYQDGQGNLCHFHMLICTEEKPFDAISRSKLEAMIAGCPGDLVSEAEVPEYIRKGLLKDRDDYFRAKGQAFAISGPRVLVKKMPTQNWTRRK